MKLLSQNLIWTNVWQNIYTNTELKTRKAREKVHILLEHIPVTHAWTVIDLGCGTGLLARELYELKRSSILGVDFVDIKQEPFFAFVKGDVCHTNLPDNTFDLAICANILEHIKDHERFLSEVQRILKPGGYLFMVSSNPRSVMVLERWARQLIRKWYWGYQKEWSVKKLRNTLQKYKICTVEAGTIVSNGNYSFFGFFDRLITKIVPYWGRHIWLVCRKHI